MNRFIKKSMLLPVVVMLFATLATTGCARLFHGGHGGGNGGAHLVQQQSLSSEALTEVIKDDNTQLVVLLN